MACKIDLRDKIVAEADSQGVPPEIALAVATQESNLCHWAPNGAVLRGKAGEYGVMQLMPATAAALGVDPTDVDQNIHGGVKFLRQLYDKYGDWALAVQHYNGSGPAAQTYARRVLAIANRYGLALTVAGSSPSGASGVVGKASTASTPSTTSNGSAVQVAGISISTSTLIGAGIIAGAGLLGLVIAG